MDESSNKSKPADFWDRMAKEAYRLNMDPTDLDSMINKDVLTLVDLKQALDYIVTPEILVNHANEIHSFYKENLLWAELPLKVGLEHKVVLPFPEIKGLETPELTEKIFKEKTKLLMRTVSTALANCQYSDLNWWYVVKKLYPELDNQILIQFKPKGEVSFFPRMGQVRISWEDFLSNRRGFNSFYSRIMLSLKDYGENQDRFMEVFRRFFKPWPIRKRLRVLSQVTFPFDVNIEDTMSMFLSIPEAEWNEDYFKENPAFHHKLLNILNFKDIHDLVLLTVRKKTNPLKSMNQSELLFLEQEVFDGGYSIKIPKSNHDLDLISHRLNNCVGRAGYFEKVLAGQIFILEVVKDKNSYACLEFDRKTKIMIQKKMERNQEFKDIAFIKDLERRINRKSPSFITKLLKWIRGDRG